MTVEGKVVVAGAGLMGTGIAHAFAAAGYRTALVDLNAEALSRAKASIGKILDDGVRISDERLVGKACCPRWSP